MEIREKNIEEDILKLKKYGINPSYSKIKRIIDNATRLNDVFDVAFSKEFNPDLIKNPYYDIIFRKNMSSDYNTFVSLTLKYKDLFLELANNYLRVLENNNFFNIQRLYKNNNHLYNNEEVKEMVLSFFDEQGNDKYKIVKDMFDKKRIGVPKQSLTGETWYGFSFASTIPYIEPYVVYGAEDNEANLQEISTLVHEFGHAIEATFILNRNSDFYSDKSRIFTEAASRFYELEFLRYLEKNKINSRFASIILNEFYDDCKLFFSYLNYGFTNNPIVIGKNIYIPVEEGIIINKDKDIVRHLTTESGKSKTFTFDYHYYLRHGFGIYMALYLSELKKQNPKDFDKAWNYYLSSRTLMDYSEILNLFGLDVNKLLSCEMIEPTIKKDLNNYVKSLKK